MRRFRFILRSLQRHGFRLPRRARLLAGGERLALSRWHTLNASQRQAETRSLGMIPLLRQELADRRAALNR